LIESNTILVNNVATCVLIMLTDSIYVRTSCTGFQIFLVVLHHDLKKIYPNHNMLSLLKSMKLAKVIKRGKT